jgi:hypothetical protein
LLRPWEWRILDIRLLIDCRRSHALGSSTPIREATMIRNIALTTALVVLLAPASPVFGQTSSTTDDDFFAWVRQGNFRPFIEASYGYSMPAHNGVEAEFAPVGSAEAILGFSEIEPYGSQYVVSIDERYAFGTYTAPDINPFEDAEPGQLETNMYRFGVGFRLGYGYRAGPLEILPYAQHGFLTTKVEWEKRPPSLAPGDTLILNRYEGDYRGSMSAEAGVKVRLFKGLSALAGYEMQVVYSRFVFGQWFGSFMTQYAGQAAITYFSDEIVNVSPVIGPILYWVLKNGLSVAFYELMKDDQFWPFDSETPLTMDTLKIGAALTF